MPKVTGYMQRENGIRAWIAYGMNVHGIRTRGELLKRIGMPRSTWDYRIAHPETFRLSEIWMLEKVIGKYEEIG